MKRLRKEQRKILKKPLGKIILESSAKKEGISIGDFSSYSLIISGKTPRVVIRDGKIQRKEASDVINSTLEDFGEFVFKVKNPPGTITDLAEEAVKLAIESEKRCRIDVEGEEDLLTLLAIKYGNLGDHVYYGQPGTGLVEVRIDKKIKEFVEKVISEMEEVT